MGSALPVRNDFDDKDRDNFAEIKFLKNMLLLLVILLLLLRLLIIIHCTIFSLYKFASELK